MLVTCSFEIDTDVFTQLDRRYPELAHLAEAIDDEQLIDVHLDFVVHIALRFKYCYQGYGLRGGAVRWLRREDLSSAGCG